jgi:porphobilinogen synthase
VAESSVTASDLILPFFVVHGEGVKKEIEPLPGNYHLSVDLLVEEVARARDLGILAVLLFGLPAVKDEAATEAYASDGIVQQAVRALKAQVPEVLVATDVCMCEYTENAHCGVIVDGYVDNDATLELLAKTAVSHAEAGADIVAPAAMMDGQIQAIRSALDEDDYTNTILMAYAAKYSSSLYDPFFRHGTESLVAFGDKKTHQMDYANSDEAVRELALDADEGADILMVKPALFYLDIVRRAKEEFRLPLAVYNVSGEYAMIKAAAARGLVDENAVVMETMTAFKRAGADLIITYFATQVARILADAA